MIFYEPAVESSPRRMLKPAFTTNTVTHQTRWSPPSTPRYKWNENSPFRSRFLSSSPPLSGNNQNSRTNHVHGNSTTTSTLNLNQLSDKGDLRVFYKKGMDSPNSANDADSQQSNSLQLYNVQADRERANPSMMGSPGEHRREFGLARAANNGVPVMAPMHAPIQSGYAMGQPPGTKMLVDPVTGQQYFLPTAQPQVAYYPVFYNAAPPQSQPIYYQATPAPTGFFVPSQQPVPTSPSHHSTSQPMFFQQHQPQQHAQKHDPIQMCHFSSQNMGGTSPPTSNITQQSSHNPGYAYNSQAYRVEIPPSNASVASSSYFQRHHESRVSTESGASSNSSRNKHSDDSMSPGNTQRGGMECAHQYPQTHQLPNAKHFAENWPRNANARYSSATSSSSGFVSGDATNLEKSRLSARVSAASDLQGSPSHTATQNETPMRWWHSDSSHYAQCARADNERSEFMNINEHHHLNISQNRDSSASPKSNNESPPPPKPTQKAIRMDIDLSQLLVTEKAAATEKIAVKANFTPPTAFTISFDDAKVASEERSGRDDNEKTPISLQDAARQAPTGRRLMRRSVPPSKASALSSTDANGNQNFAAGHLQDPKEYLFSKMFENCGRRSESGTSDEMTASHMSSNFGAKRETDTLSEAGTYIVENKNGQGMICSQIIDSDEDSDASSSTSTTISDKAIRNTSPANEGHNRNLHQNFQKPDSSKIPDFGKFHGGGGVRLSAHPNNADDNSVSPVLARRSLMSDLRKLREEKSLPSLTGIAPTSPRRLQAKAPAATRPLFPTIASQKPTNNVFSTRLCQNQARPVSGGGANPNVFRPTPRCHSETRAGWRPISMRSSAASSSSGYSGTSKPPARNVDLKPPFRTGVGSCVKPFPNKNVAQMQETPEMVAWLRRKEYDPRKAAAEAKKMQQLKQSLIKLANGYERVLECEIGVESGETDSASHAKNIAEDTYLANRSISYHNSGGFSSGANSAFQHWKKPMGDDRSNKSYDNLSRLGEENTDEFSQLNIGESSNNLKRTVDALTEKCHKSIELIRLCNKNSLSPSVENLLQSVVDSSNPLYVEERNFGKRRRIFRKDF